MDGFIVGRRALLRGTGVALALPFLDAMASSRAPTRRMVCIGNDLSFNPDTWLPATTGTAFKPSPLLEPLERHRQSYTVFSHLEHPMINKGHESVHAYLSGVLSSDAKAWPDGNITVDQRAAEFLAGKTRIPSLHIGVSPTSGRMSWTRSGVAVPTTCKPAEIFQALFREDSADEKRQRIHQFEVDRTVLDAVMAQAKDLQRKLGRADQAKLDEYFTSVRAVEKSIAELGQWVHKPKPQADGKAPTNPGGWAELGKLVPIVYDMIVLALRTDSTRVVTFQMEGTQQPVSSVPDVSLGYHTLTHHGKSPERLEQLLLIEKFHTSSFAKFLDQLQAANLLDETMVLLGSGMGNANQHTCRDLPILLAGGGFKHGQHLDVPKGTTGGQNTPLCNLYARMLQRLGLDIDKFNSGSGALTALEFA